MSLMIEAKIFLCIDHELSKQIIFFRLRSPGISWHDPVYQGAIIYGLTALSAKPTWQNITWGFNNLCRAVCHNIGDELDQQSRHVSAGFW